MPAARGAATASRNTRGALVWVRLLLNVPFRTLRRACDSYERGMTRCAGSRSMVAGFSNISGGSTTAYPRSNSVRSRSTSEDDHRELVRVASHSLMATRGGGGAAGPDISRRSRSAAVCRIDEDEETDFGSADAGELSKLAYPRSWSYAINNNHRSRMGTSAAAGVQQ